MTNTAIEENTAIEGDTAIEGNTAIEGKTAIEENTAIKLLHQKGLYLIELTSMDLQVFFQV
jgi:bifunctional N-acetylglucosamine-1-phosphate-uridyltransferase/glucosamine-1-phosphate-acetyltransferase GlmU-like protein